MSEEEEHLFQRSNSCWICKKLVNNDEKVRDHYHVTGKFRGAAHWEQHINVIPNGLEKYMASFLSKNLVFIDSMQFMNSSLDKVVKDLSDEDFKYLVEEFGS